MISGEFKIEKEFEVKNNLQMHVTSMDKINSCAYINVKIFAHGNRTFINIDVPFTNEENTISIGSEVSLFFSIENDLEERKKITKEKINNSIDNLRRYLSRYDGTKSESEAKKTIKMMKDILNYICTNKELVKIIRNKEFRVRGL